MLVKQYSNPILRGMHPDPSIVRVDKTYYMVNSTFEYYPGITLSKSTDLLNWEQLPSIATKHSQADLSKSKSNEGIFAVCIRYHDDKFYVITTNFAEFKTFIITGKLTADGSIAWDKERINVDVNGIDPDIFFEDGHTYVQYTGYVADGKKALQQVEINLTDGSIIAGPQVISFGTGGRDVEGPHIIKHNGDYYLLAAEGGTGMGHMITIFRSKNLWGPFESCRDNPIFTNRDRADEKIQNIGHGDLFMDNNQNWWLVCLGTRPANVNFKTFTNTGRETLLYPVTWDGAWPVINNGVPTKDVNLAKFPKHAQTLTSQNIIDFSDNFESKSLKPQWSSLRDSLNDRLTLANNTLTLKGSDMDLTSIGVPSFLGIKQTELDEAFDVELNANEIELNNGQIGLALTIDNKHYASITLKKTSAGKFEVIKHVQVFDLIIDEVIDTLDQLPKKMTLINHPTYKEFNFELNNGQTVGFITSAMHFSNEAIGALNTADIYGIYVLGNDTKISISSAKRFPIKEEDLN